MTSSPGCRKSVCARARVRSREGLLRLPVYSTSILRANAKTLQPQLPPGSPRQRDSASPACIHPGVLASAEHSAGGLAPCCRWALALCI